MRYAQLVVGPAGSGKVRILSFLIPNLKYPLFHQLFHTFLLQSTYCSTIVQHAEAENKTVHVVNLDPAAEFFSYNPIADIRELIHIEDAMEDDEMRFGPNGGLIFCMEYVFYFPSYLMQLWLTDAFILSENKKRFE